MLFILNILHEELISYPGSGLISFKSQFINDISKSKEQFNNYYSTQYLKSIISDLFNWIRREERFCSFCNEKSRENRFSYSFQAFPFIFFDLDEIIDYVTERKLSVEKPKSLNLQDVFSLYSLLEHKLDKEKEKCMFCGNGGLLATYYIETSPKYFIIVINRKNKLGFTYDKKLEFKEEEGKGIHYEYKKYELMSVIIQDGNKWSCFLKKCESEENTEKIERVKLKNGSNIKMEK